MNLGRWMAYAFALSLAVVAEAQEMTPQEAADEAARLGALKADSVEGADGRNDGTQSTTGVVYAYELGGVRYYARYVPQGATNVRAIRYSYKGNEGQPKSATGDARWAFLLETDSEVIFYDQHTARVSSSSLTVWTREEFKTPLLVGGKKAVAEQDQRVLYCESGQSRLLSLVMYDRAGAAIASETSVGSPLRSMVPGSVGERWQEILCGHYLGELRLI